MSADKNFDQLVEKYARSLLLIIVLAFFAILILHIFNTEDINSPTSILLIGIGTGVGSSLAATWLTWIISKYFKKEKKGLDEIEQVKNDINICITEHKELFNIVGTCQKANIIGVTNGRIDYPAIENIIKNSNKEVLILGESLNSLVSNNKDVEKLTNLLKLKNDFELRLMLISPDSYDLFYRYKELGLEKEKVIGLHTAAIDKYQDISQKTNEKLKLRFYKHHPKVFAIISDREVSFVQHYVYNCSVSDIVTLTYGKESTSDVYCRMFDSLWDLQD